MKNCCDEALYRLIYQAMDDCRAEPNNMMFSSRLAMLIEERERRGL